LKFPVVNNFANGRFGVGGDLNQVHALFARGPNCVARIHDSEFFTLFGNDANLGHANAFVDTYDRRTAKVGTAAASETCSYYCTSSVKQHRLAVCGCG